MSASNAEPLIDLPLRLASAGADAATDVEAEVLALFDECAPSLNRYVRACGLSPAAVDDVVQESFIALFRHLSLGRPRHNLRGWLFTVAWRLALKQRQRMARQVSAEAPLEPGLAESLVDAAEDPEMRLARRQHQRRLESVMRALPERHRQCLYLRAEGLRYREIAGVLGISLGGVAKALAYAIFKLSRIGQE